MAVKDVDIGARGHLRCQVDLVEQDKDGNRSKVRVRGYIWLDSGSSSSDNTGNCKTWISGTNSRGKETTNFSVSGTTKKEICDETWWVGHDSDGKKTVNYTVSFGPTITSNFGDGGSAKVTMTLTQIPRVPSTPAKPTLTFISPDDIRAAWVAPSDNGNAITGYDLQYANNSTFADFEQLSLGVVLNRLVENLTVNQTWYFRVRAKNVKGLSNWSASSSFAILETPQPPYNVTAVFTNPSFINVAWDAPQQGGSPITEYQLQYATNAQFSSPTTINQTGRTYSLTSTVQGITYWFRIRAKNTQGYGDWSDPVSEPSLAGPKVKINGVWTNTVVYVKHQGEWKPALPYIRANGEWRIGGG